MAGDVKGSQQRKEIGARLREARSWEDGPRPSQRELGRMVGEHGAEPVESHQTVGAYERGETKIPVTYVLAACRVLDASPLWVLAGEGPERWSELRKGGWLAGAREISGRVLSSLRDALGEELFRGALRGAESIGDPPEEGLPGEIRLEDDGDAG